MYFMPDGALIGATAGLLAGAGSLGYAVRGRSSTIFGPSVYHGDRSRPALALTFDDGPSESTPALLDILARHGAPATFFMCGKNVERCPVVARDVVAAGHEVGNHSDSHRRLDFHSAAFIHREIALAQEKIQITTGVTPRLFRAPFGVRWFGLGGVQKRLGLMGVMWTVIGRDWRWSASRISQRLVEGAANGAIFCLHDGRELSPSPDIRATLEAVERAIPELKRRGFHFETVSQLLCPTN
jgi:peptidoglycan/xylan/chitin deacetylase (PgdA/CDA1 family)